MHDKSYVSVENKICPVCMKQHEHNCGVLLDTRLKSSLERTTTTGYSLCEEHERLYNEGYIALIGIDETKSDFIDGDMNKLDPRNIYRTGVIMHMRKEFFDGMFDIKVDGPFVHVQQEVIERLQKMIESQKE